MFSQFLSFCCFFFMGVSSNLEVFLSEKHLNDHKEDREFINTILTTTPAMEQTNNEQEDECNASTKQDLMHELIKTTKQQPVQEQRYHDEQGKEGHHHQVITQQEKQQQSMGDDDDDDDKNAVVLPPVVVVLPPSTAAPLGLTKLEIPSLYKEVTEKQEGSNDDEEDGFKTPKSPEHRIPAMLRCPPAPRKPKPTSSSTSKRKGCSCRARVVLDFSEEIESLFPTPFAADLGDDTGGNNKKVKLKLFAEPQ